MEEPATDDILEKSRDPYLKIAWNRQRPVSVRINFKGFRLKLSGLSQWYNQECNEDSSPRGLGFDHKPGRR